MIVASAFPDSTTVKATRSGEGVAVRMDAGSDVLTLHLSRESLRSLVEALQEASKPHERPWLLRDGDWVLGAEGEVGP